MKKSEVQKSVTAAVAEVLDESQGDIGLDCDLSDDLGADSLDLVEIIMGLEERYTIVLHNLDWASTGKVTARKISEDICRFIRVPVV